MRIYEEKEEMGWIGVDKEREKNKKERGSFVCGEEGHWARNCKKKRTKNKNASTVIKQNTWHGNAL